MDDFQHALPPPENMKSAERRFWRNYNEEADKYDEVLTNSWKGDMDSILIFAGLFSAALTAFIVQSYQKLQPDSGDQALLVLKQLLLVQTALAVGNSSPAALPSPTSVIPHFRPPTSILICNIFWFLSLSFSLASALAATLVQQWIRSYLQDSRDSSPIMHAKIRIYLHDGIKDFKMNRIVGVIPTLLHISLFLFYAGVIAFFYNVNKVIAGLHVAIIACVLLVYSFMTLLALLHRRSPFTTPVAHFFWWLIGMFYKFLVNRYQKPEDPQKVPTDVLKTYHVHTGTRTNPPRESVIRYKIVKNLNRLLTPYEESRRKAAKEEKEANCKRERQAFTWYLNTCSEDSEFENFVELFPLTYHEEKAKKILYPIILQESGFSKVGERLLRRILDLFCTCTDALGPERRARRIEICTLAIEWIISIQTEHLQLSKWKMEEYSLISNTIPSGELDMSIQPEILQPSTWKMDAYSYLSNSISSGTLDTTRCSHLLPLVIMLTQLDNVFNLLVKFSPNINNYCGDAEHPHEDLTDLLSNSLLKNWTEMKSESPFLIGQLIQSFPLEYKIIGCLELITLLLESFCNHIKQVFSSPDLDGQASESLPTHERPAHYLQFFHNAALELSSLNNDCEFTVQNLDQYLEKLLSLPALKLNVFMFQKGLDLCKAARHRDFTSYQVQFSKIHKKATFLAALAVCYPHLRPPYQRHSLPATYRAMDHALLRILVNINDGKRISLTPDQLSDVANETSLLYMEIINSRISSGSAQLSDNVIGINYAMDLLFRIEEKFQTNDKLSSEPLCDDTEIFMSKTIAKIKEELDRSIENAHKRVSILETLHNDLPFSIYRFEASDKSSVSTDPGIPSESNFSVETMPVQTPSDMNFGGHFPESSQSLSISTSDLTYEIAEPKNKGNEFYPRNNLAWPLNGSEVGDEKGPPEFTVRQQRPSLSRARQLSVASMHAAETRTNGTEKLDMRMQDSRPYKPPKSVAFKDPKEAPDTDRSRPSAVPEKGTEAMQTVAIHGRDGTTETVHHIR